MSQNTLPCGKCVHFDRMIGPGDRKQPYGWCAARSVYPFKEGPGQKFPPGVQRVASAATPAKPLIVYQDGIEQACTKMQAKE